MSHTYNISSLCLRYVVPFTFSGRFEEVFQAVETQCDGLSPLWHRKIMSPEQGESDLYDYIRNEFRIENSHGPLTEQKIGCEWLFQNSSELGVGNTGKIFEVMYFENPLSPEDTEFSGYRTVQINNLGLILFRNSLGFLWYELSFPQDSLNSEQLILFQSRVKELNPNEWERFFWTQTSLRPANGLAADDPHDRQSYLVPFSFGKWITERLNFLKIHFLAEQTSTYNRMVNAAMNGTCSLSNERLIKVLPPDDPQSKMPDKALLFTYCAFENRNPVSLPGEREETAYHLTNGYRTSYHFSPEVLGEMKHPFSDVLWYATQEGASYLAWPEHDNREVFNRLIPLKVKLDYYTLYLKVLYQMYSLLIYARKIQEEISADHEKYLTESLSPQITTLFGEINLFLTKSMAASVSHIHHQSAFYIYLNTQLRVHDDVNSVTAGLNALNALKQEQRQREENKRLEEKQELDKKREQHRLAVREKMEDAEKLRDEKLQAIMGLFALLGIFSALADCFSIGKSIADNEWQLLSNAALTVDLVGGISILVISALTVFFCAKSIHSAFKSHSQEHDSEDDRE